MLRRYFKPENERRADQQKLSELKQDILKKIPGAGISADQPYREADLAIDFCEDIPPLPTEAVDQIVGLFKEAGAETKVKLGAKAMAFIKRRGYVIPEDVRAICYDVMRHRVAVTYEAEAEEMSSGFCEADEEL